MKVYANIKVHINVFAEDNVHHVMQQKQHATSAHASSYTSIDSHIMNCTHYDGIIPGYQISTAASTRAPSTYFTSNKINVYSYHLYKCDCPFKQSNNLKVLNTIIIL